MQPTTARSAEITDLDLWIAFAVSASLVVAVPDSGAMTVIDYGLAGGRIGGLAAAMGATAGYTLSLALSLAGAEAILAGSETAFLALKWAGGAYLIRSGLHSIMKASRLGATDQAGLFWSRARAGLHGTFVNTISNPTAIILFVAFVRAIHFTEGSISFAIACPARGSQCHCRDCLRFLCAGDGNPVPLAHRPIGPALATASNWVGRGCRSLPEHHAHRRVGARTKDREPLAALSVCHRLRPCGAGRGARGEACRGESGERLADKEWTILDAARPGPSISKGTIVIRLPTREAVGKINADLPDPDEGPPGVWSGTLPLSLVAGGPKSDEPLPRTYSQTLQLGYHR